KPASAARCSKSTASRPLTRLMRFASSIHEACPRFAQAAGPVYAARTMKLSLKPQHLKRYRQIASLMLRFGFGEVVRGSGLADLLGEELGKLTQKAQPNPHDFVHELEELGPTFVKLGQVLS